MIGSMQLVESDNCAAAHTQAGESILQRLKSNCEEGRSILLLISGGSSMGVVVQALSQLTDEELAHITVSQVNERFVEAGSEDSHWQQFVQTFGGIEALHEAIPILSTGKNLSETVNNYDLELTKQIQKADYTLAVCGVGVDGSIAGMHPTDGVTFQLFLSDDVAVGLRGSAVSYTHLTLPTTYGV